MATEREHVQCLRLVRKDIAHKTQQLFLAKLELAVLQSREKESKHVR